MTEQQKKKKGTSKKKKIEVNGQKLGSMASRPDGTITMSYGETYSGSSYQESKKKKKNHKK